jgi:formate dehydrogenase subunit delta
MQIDTLLRMANQIGDFFGAMPERDEALQDMATHIKKFWTSAMRHALLTHAEAQAGQGLSAFAAEAIARHRAMLNGQ